MTDRELVGKVHFTIKADFITGFARELWAEGEYQRALDFLGTLHGVTYVQKHRIIVGKLKFKEVGKTQRFKLVKDDWKPNLSHCHFRQYPNPDNGEEMEAARRVLLLDQTKKQYNRRISVLLDKADEDEKVLLHIQAFFLSFDFDNDALEPEFEEGFSELEKDVDALVRVSHIRRTGYTENFAMVDKFLKEQRINSAIEEATENKIAPKPGAIYENGIVKPNGDFYRCGSMGHNLLAIALGYPADNSKSEFAALEAALADGCCAVTTNLKVRHIRKGKGGITKAQQKRLTEWLELTKYSDAIFVQYDFGEVFESRETSQE